MKDTQKRTRSAEAADQPAKKQKHLDASSKPTNTNAKSADAKKYKKIVKGPQQESHSSAAVRKRIRDTERLLKRPNLAADVRVELERRLQSLKFEVSENTQEQKEKTLYEKYKYLRFVEQKKVSRKLRQAEKLVADSTEPDEALLRQLHYYKVLMNYIQHYPRDMKYIALFPKNEPDESTDPSELDAETAGFDVEADTNKERRAIKMKISELVTDGLIHDGLVLRQADVFGSSAKAPGTGPDEGQLPAKTKTKKAAVPPPVLKSKPATSPAPVDNATDSKKSRKTKKASKSASTDKAEQVTATPVEENESDQPALEDTDDFFLGGDGGDGGEGDAPLVIPDVEDHEILGLRENEDHRYGKQSSLLDRKKKKHGPDGQDWQSDRTRGRTSGRGGKKQRR
ncbi:uncharacterized protein BJ171DRAFT_507591 [Polychytrium aggregatum]|uniref:uncharacterized protein n=1 Tax=Polychytrium aggregatum TaxID=110093 RepID=UPI0022FDB19E|nr:uncharacterized protein BJ171DRAFT_507591 [Polychytrium aggregatum]KAI9204081.1 hypothetical protein BJ171DRAFT_507591 [Polychytrium aggregatum]